MLILLNHKQVLVADACTDNIYKHDREKCSFYSDSNFCHQLHHTRNQAVRQVMKKDDFKLLMFRSGLERTWIMTICAHLDKSCLQSSQA